MKLFTPNITKLKKVDIEQLVYDNIEHFTSKDQIDEFIEQVRPFSEIDLTYDYTLTTAKEMYGFTKHFKKLRLLENARRKDIVQSLKPCQRTCFSALTQLEDKGIPDITDRIIMDGLRWRSVNQVSPRFSELIRLGIVVTGDKVKSPVTGAYVRTLKTARKEEEKYYRRLLGNSDPVLEHKPITHSLQEAA